MEGAEDREREGGILKRFVELNGTPLFFKGLLNASFIMLQMAGVLSTWSRYGLSLFHVTV